MAMASAPASTQGPRSPGPKPQAPSPSPKQGCELRAASCGAARSCKSDPGLATTAGRALLPLPLSLATTTRHTLQLHLARGVARLRWSGQRAEEARVNRSGRGNRAMPPPPSAADAMPLIGHRQPLVMSRGLSPPPLPALSWPRTYRRAGGLGRCVRRTPRWPRRCRCRRWGGEDRVVKRRSSITRCLTALCALASIQVLPVANKRVP
jgi:hypothetical protein